MSPSVASPPVVNPYAKKPKRNAFVTVAAGQHRASLPVYGGKLLMHMTVVEFMQYLVVEKININAKLCFGKDVDKNIKTKVRLFLCLCCCFFFLLT